VPRISERAVKILHGEHRRAGIGGQTPTTFATGYLYAGMGYTTSSSGRSLSVSAKHTHESW